MIASAAPNLGFASYGFRRRQGLVEALLVWQQERLVGIGLHAECSLNSDDSFNAVYSPVLEFLADLLDL